MTHERTMTMFRPNNIHHCPSPLHVAFHRSMKHAKQQLIIVLLRVQARTATLKIIPYRAIEQVLAPQKDTFQDQTDFNIVYHKREEIEAMLPDLQHFAPDTQS